MNTKYYTLEPGRTLEDVAHAICSWMAGSRMEYHPCGPSDGQWIIHGRTGDPSVCTRKTGRNETATVTLTSFGPNAFRAEIRRGRFRIMPPAVLVDPYVPFPPLLAVGLRIAAEATLPARIHRVIRDSLKS